MSVRVPTYTADQVRAAELPLLEAGEPLMQRAAAALADVVRAELGHLSPRVALSHALEPVVRQRPDAPLPRALVLAGAGDNGGDALFAAAGITDAADVDVVIVADRFHEAGLAAAVGAGARRLDLAELCDVGGDYAVIVDGILGIGASRNPALRGPAREAVTTLLAMNSDGGPTPRVIAVDIPSGLHPDTGEADDAVLPASITVTFGAVKAGLATGRGPDLAGEIVLVDIGLGPGLASAAPAGEATVARIVTVPRP